MNCKKEGQVCGMDGDTYLNECVAKSRGVPIDYVGECRGIGSIGGKLSTLVTLYMHKMFAL